MFEKQMDELENKINQLMENVEECDDEHNAMVAIHAVIDESEKAIDEIADFLDGLHEGNNIIKLDDVDRLMYHLGMIYFMTECINTVYHQMEAED